MTTGPKNLIDDGCGARVLVWGLDGIEDNTIEQAQKTARLPFVVSHVALMPDAHVGFGSTVGSVIATSGAIIPGAVGVDIGCGMIASRLNVRADQLPDTLVPLYSAIAKAIPAGVGIGHDASELRGIVPPGWAAKERQPEMVLASNKLWHKTVTQFGTLGSGNHFVEVCLDADDSVWLVLHSGSRGVGNEIAKRHIDGAKKLMKSYFIHLEDPDLAYFVQGTPQFEEYIHDMLWAQDYARENRGQMMTAALCAFGNETGLEPDVTLTVNAHHNYTEQEHHMGRDLWVTRKGAIRARVGDWGIIPGSMATGTHIVQGLGNPASFTSASHGAGRRMSRGQARRELDRGTLVSAMEGIAWNHDDSLIDEDPRSYKPIEDVMDAQLDLVETKYVLRQVLNYKGT